MRLFHEIYNRYIELLFELFRMAQSSGGVTREEIVAFISERGFFYDNIAFEDALLGRFKKDGSIEGGDNLNILSESDGTYMPLFPAATRRILMTKLEKSWLRTVLSDPRAALFLSDDVLHQLESGLSGFPLLFNLDDVLLRNTRTNGDPYTDTAFVATFRTVLAAVRDKRWLQVKNITSSGQTRVSIIKPYRLEYSLKDDVFRVCGGVRTDDGGLTLVSMRLSRIAAVDMAGQAEAADVRGDFELLMEARKAPELALFEIVNERNGFERFLHFFSNYNRTAKYNKESGSLFVELEYYTFDEAELIISILAMGPIVKVLGPSTLKDKIVERLKWQNTLLQTY